MSSQLTCGSKRVAKMLASRLRFTERRPLPWPFPVTHVFFLGRAPVDFTRDGCVVFCRRRTTVVHSVVVGAQMDVDDAQTDVDGAQTDVDGAQTSTAQRQTLTVHRRTSTAHRRTSTAHRRTSTAHRRTSMAHRRRRHKDRR